MNSPSFGEATLFSMSLNQSLAQNSQALYSLLHSLPSQPFEHELEFMRAIIPGFVATLGYAESETFYGYGGGPSRYHVDVALSTSIEATPWVIIEVNTNKSKSVNVAISQLERYLESFKARIGVMLSPELLIIISDNKLKSFDLKAVSIEGTNEIFDALRRGIQSSLSTATPSSHTKLIQLIEGVEQATTNALKGKSLEDLAKLLFESTLSLTCKYTNMQTRSSEIDLGVEYNLANGRIPLFEESGRYCLVECKNWSKPVGVGAVRDFMGKLDKCKVRLGIILSKNGITGVDSGGDAVREIQSRFDRDGIILLIFSIENLRSVASGKEFLAAIDRKADELLFDLASG